MGPLRIRVLGPGRPSRWKEFERPCDAVDFLEQLWSLIDLEVLMGPPPIEVETEDPKTRAIVSAAWDAIRRAGGRESEPSPGN